MVTHTPSLFQVLHADTMKMTPPSNGCNNIIHGRDSLSSWPEARATKDESAATLGRWLLEDIICQWGCILRIVMDNGSSWKAAVKWIKDKYGIEGITILPYNSQANGKIERPHFNMREALSKATSKDLKKWFWFLPLILWSDRVTIRRGTGCSPFFMATGAEPLLPLDVIEATWLVELPDRTFSTEEVVGYRAQALAKHHSHVQLMRERVDKRKREAVLRYENEFKNVIKDYSFKHGDLVLMRHTEIEDSLNRKMFPQYLGPMVVIR